MREGEELKAPRYASAAALCNDYVIIYNIIPNTNNIPILVLEEFLVLKDNKLNKAKFLIKLKEALVPETLLIFNRYILI